MPDYPIYGSKEMLDDAFPFKIEVRRPETMNAVLHAHEHMQLCYMRSGSCLHWAGGQRHVLTKGDLFSIPPYQEHRLERRDAMDFVMIQVDFMPHAIHESFRDLASIETFVDFAFIRPLIAEADLMPKMTLPLPAQAVVENLLDVIVAEWTDKEEGYRLAIRAELLKLLVLTCRQYKRYSGAESSRERQQVAHHRKAFFETIEYMERHYDEELHLEDMAARALMAPSYFSNLLKLVKGKSYIELLSALRIQSAMELLRGTDLSVTEIAARAGYNHISHFNRTFKKHTGLTPGDYRKHQT
ncbi:AraC family transcriptional regulator [Cohnella sp. JJ-181]|uniref:AraC family transcriptional regulator n=1 Tax=Cohnella rhizoplanae TaxID=2974897 RepID=UPI0022FF6FB4|nr:AraC family transcriptional regulator [Cohnella sp. JJ-181]CAI6044297.1 HTH-type transcriptional regulator ChbR [Cohnella sp. JJ-181]